MKLLDPNDPFFAKAWVRWLTGLLPIGWGANEFYNSSPAWGLIFIAAGVYALWVLVFTRADSE